MFVVTLLALALAVNAAAASTNSSNLGQQAVQTLLQYGRPILGDYTSCNEGLCTWMSQFPDDLSIVRMNIPGVHDTATWNYSQTTQDSLEHITASGITGSEAYQPEPAEFYRCQDQPIFEMLNGGIRAFDLRYAFDPTNSSLVFYHSAALQSETATVQDILYGFYHWLDDHPSEAVFLSFMYESSTTEWAQNNAAVQQMLYGTLTNDVAQEYISPIKDRFGTLGDIRGKIVLLRRFTLDLLPASAEATIPGVHFPPSNWTDNSPNITLIYNLQTNGIAYIEDYYEIGLPNGAGAALNIQWKFNATTAHLEMAASEQWKDSLFWSFASSEHDTDVPSPETPIIQALGNGTDVPGVNQKLLPWLEARKGSRWGIVMLDFFGNIPGLVKAVIGI
ncbi:PLC-like phosphodiesterase [Dacryopinax primogenitus]|uniref:PLC-like phosphodiesterase n=1 Tax=Dacryopinax primogenitus (strain DJM 731) TaxID=1858805 RepID=M5FWU5_DACPD|nr:PLC-like phosphodiesterase [Dacryopinax primogenitus]EJT97921.1 PLC-like phosphodiesterase [Dacryopinax primogenitus]